MTIRVAALALSLAMAGPVLAASDVNVSSPDGRIQFRLFLNDKRGLQYSVTFRAKPAIETSALGLSVNGVNLAEGVEIGAVDSYKVDETYPWYGLKSTAVDNCNGVKVTVTHRQSRTAYTLEARAYNDGIAFRHVVPGEGTRVPDEATEFRLPKMSQIWWHNLDESYENFYQRKIIGIGRGQYATVPAGSWVAPPATLVLPEGAGYVSITEGALRNYSGMVLQADGDGGLLSRLGHAAPASWQFRAYRSQFSVEKFATPASITGTITTPWRIVMIGADLNALVNCDIVHNVAAPPDPKLFPQGLKTDWIKPGRATWVYMDGGNNTVEGQKQVADLAQQLGFEYNVIEGVWSKWPEGQLKELVDYSRQRGVRDLIWRHSGQLTDEKSVRELFEICRRNGAAGVKIDFFDHEHKEVIDQYEMILKLAAEYHLIVDFHGANKPTGLERTYPNLLGVEAVRGMEKELLARHNVTLPFTRCLAGLVDFTPTNFSPRWMADTTWAHQVANAVILQAPLLVYIAHPANILGNPTADVVKSIPAAWDETVVLPISEIGEVAAFARRKGNMWFLAVNNGPVAKVVRADLSFLGQGSYMATLVRDGAEASSVKIDHMSLRSTDSISIDLRSGGGFVARLIK
jgi:alpha-glucosidase